MLLRNMGILFVLVAASVFAPDIQTVASASSNERSTTSVILPALEASATSTATMTISATGSATSTNSTPNGPRTTHLVKAGADGFHFEPQQLEDVIVGDVITFEFYPPDHSVARAEYGSACVPYEYTGKGKTGFWSGTQWVDTVDDVGYSSGSKATSSS
jgi:hypothetical protein